MREFTAVPNQLVREREAAGSFFAEKLEALGERVPWKREVRRRVLLDWHDDTNGTPGGVMSVVNPDMERLLSLIPGVTVVGKVTGELEEMDICGTGTFTDEQGRPRWLPPEMDARERTAKADRIADLAAAQGADTIVCTHFWDHQRWGRYASDRLAVRQAISILAEALGCDHPDRAQAANRTGDPVEVVRQTRPIWSSWGMSEAEALELATNSIYAISGGFTGCSCSVHAHRDVIPVDVVRGVAPGLPRPQDVAGRERTASPARTQ